VWAKRTDVLWIWGNIWSMEGENWEKWVRKFFNNSALNYMYLEENRSN